MDLRRALVAAFGTEGPDLDVMTEVLIHFLGRRDANTLLKRLEKRKRTPRAFLNSFKRQINAPDHRS